MKKTLLSFFIFGIIYFINSKAQNSQWINYTNGNKILCIAEETNYVWIGTENGGLVKFNKLNNSSTFYNKKQIQEYQVIIFYQLKLMLTAKNGLEQMQGLQFLMIITG